MTAYFPLIQKDYAAHMHGIAVHVKGGFYFARDISLETSTDPYYLFDWLYFIFLYRSPSSSLCSAFDAILSNIDEALSINLLASQPISLGDFIVHHKY